MLKDEYISIKLGLSEQVGNTGTGWFLSCDVRFLESNSGYGNDTYMDIKWKDGSYSPVIDIRYDHDYDPGMSDAQHILYVLDYLINHYMRKTIEVNSVEAVIKVDLGKED